MSALRSKSNPRQDRPRACDYCRLKKIRCDGLEKPGKSCTHCIANKKDCTYDTQSKRRGPTKSYVASLELRLASMQRLLQKHVPSADLAREFGVTPPPPDYTPTPVLDDADCNDTSGICLRRHLQKYMETVTTPRSPSDSTLNIDSDGDDDLSLNGREKGELGTEHGRYHGESSGLRFLQTARNLKQEYGNSNGADAILNANHVEVPGPAEWELALWQDERNLSASASFPPIPTIRHLFSLYFRHVAPFLPIIHQSTFEAQFEDGLHRRNSRFAVVVLLVCAVAAKFDGASDSSPNADVGWRCFAQTRDWSMSLAPAGLTDLQGWVLTAYYFCMTGSPHAAWSMLGVAARFAFDSGIHVSRARARRSFRDTTTPAAIEYEQWKRAFWCLISLDRDISAGLGRTPACREEDMDIELPREDPMPTGEISDIQFFNSSLHLGQLLSFTLRSIYTVKRPLVLTWLGERWEERIVAELDAALEKWVASIPEHLRWDPDRANLIHFEQSASLYTSYYRLIILIHRPFLPTSKSATADQRSSKLGNPLAPSALDICASAARKCSDIVACQAKRGSTIQVGSTVCAFTSAVVILTKVWGARKVDPKADVKDLLKDVRKCITGLKATEDIMANSVVFVEILRELAGFGDLPLDTASPLDDETFALDDGLQMDSLGAPFANGWDDPPSPPRDDLFGSMDSILGQETIAGPSAYENILSSLEGNDGYYDGGAYGSALNLEPDRGPTGTAFDPCYATMGPGLSVPPGETFGSQSTASAFGGSERCSTASGGANGLMGMWSSPGESNTGNNAQQWESWASHLANVRFWDSVPNLRGSDQDRLHPDLEGV